MRAFDPLDGGIRSRVVEVGAQERAVSREAQVDLGDLHQFDGALVEVEVEDVAAGFASIVQIVQVVAGDPDGALREAS